MKNYIINKGVKKHTILGFLWGPDPACDDSGNGGRVCIHLYMHEWNITQVYGINFAKNKMYRI